MTTRLRSVPWSEHSSRLAAAAVAGHRDAALPRAPEHRSPGWERQGVRFVRGPGLPTPRSASFRRHGREVKTGKKGDFVADGPQPRHLRADGGEGRFERHARNPGAPGRCQDSRSRSATRRHRPIRSAKSAALQKSFDDGRERSESGKHEEAIAKFHRDVGLAPIARTATTTSVTATSRRRTTRR